MNDLIAYLARFVHIASAVTLLGGMIFGAVAWLPAVRFFAETERQSTADAIAARFRPWMLAAVAGLFASGFYNYLAKRAMPPLYHMIFGMKFLLALHVFVVGYLALRRGQTNRQRQIKGVVISGLVILALSAWLRYLSLNVILPK